MRIRISELVQSAKGGNPELQGTWVHPYVAIHLAQWLSPRFAVQVSKWVYEWTGDLRRAAGELKRLVDQYRAQGRSEEWIMTLSGRFLRELMAGCLKNQSPLSGLSRRTLASPRLRLGRWLKQKRHIGVVPRPLMMLVAMRAQQSSVALSKSFEARQISDDAGRDFAICLGAPDDKHGNHGNLLQLR